MKGDQTWKPLQPRLFRTDGSIAGLVPDEMDGGFLWPDPLIQLNPSFEPGETLQDLIKADELHPECRAGTPTSRRPRPGRFRSPST